MHDHRVLSAVLTTVGTFLGIAVLLYLRSQAGAGESPTADGEGHPAGGWSGAFRDAALIVGGVAVIVLAILTFRMSQ
jgi:hypothetical protein